MIGVVAAPGSVGIVRHFHFLILVKTRLSAFVELSTCRIAGRSQASLIVGHARRHSARNLAAESRREAFSAVNQLATAAITASRTQANTHVAVS
jgi:hypothetical protein